jgi:hypothetical protein
MVIMESLYLKTGKIQYEIPTRFGLKYLQSPWYYVATGTQWSLNLEPLLQFILAMLAIFSEVLYGRRFVCLD